MEKIFRKVTAGFLSIFFMSLMLVSAGVYPNPFVNNNEADVAVVYGANAAATDSTAADSLVNSLADGIVTAEELDRILSAGVSEDEVELGLIIRGGKIRATLTDNKIPSLIDGKIYWYDGDNTESYNVHEELIIGDLKLETTLDNNDFDEVVLTNNKALEYRYVFDEDVFNDAELGAEDAEPLEITILGEDYLIEDIDGNSITVTKAEEAILKIGSTVSFEGKTLTIDDIYDDAINVNGVFIKEGKRKTVNGIQVKVETIYYKDSATLPSKVKIYYGGEISKEYSNRDAYIGEDEDDPEWVWSIDRPGEKGGYIGVKYDLKQIDEEDDVVYEGEEYTYPNGFATVRFDSLTDVDYYDYNVYFDEVRLYTGDGDDEGDKLDNVNGGDNVEVIVIEGTEEDSFELANSSIETDTLYLRKVDGGVEVYYKDVAEDLNPKGKKVWYKTIDVGALQVLVGAADDAQTLADDSQDAAATAQAEADVAQDAADAAVVDDEAAATAQAEADVDSGNETLQDAADAALTLANLTNATELQVAAATAQGLADDAQALADAAAVAAVTAQDLVDSYDLSIATLVADDTEKEVSLSTDGESLSIGNIQISLGDEGDEDDGEILIGDKSIRTKENDVMDYYGTIIESPESNLEDDRVVLKIPSEQVYAQISVLGSEEDDEVVVNDLTPSELNITKVTDGQVPTGKNLIVVGGSCVNTLAAELLGGSYCGAEFTSHTGVGAGHFLIQTFDRGNGNVVTLVAGYNAEDTQKGVTYLLNNNLNIAVGGKIII